MSTQTKTVDQDQALRTVLDGAKQRATSKGHNMGPWRFEDAPAREFLVVSRCINCNAALRVDVPLSESIDVFPIPVIDEYSAAFRYRCLNPSQ
ncbi:MAG: hypothetical protein JWO59_2022 [Chloroflexi bacterium]|nr:hypothetical protein [Chloroflexota bacterium]